MCIDNVTQGGFWDQFCVHTWYFGDFFVLFLSFWKRRFFRFYFFDLFLVKVCARIHKHNKYEKDFTNFEKEKKNTLKSKFFKLIFGVAQSLPDAITHSPFFLDCLVFNWHFPMIYLFFSSQWTKLWKFERFFNRQKATYI